MYYKNIDNVTNENFLLYAIKNYDKPNSVMSEFKDDIKRFNYLKRLFRRYRKTGEVKERLILNHLVVIYNVFGIEAATKLLFLRMSVDDYSALKTFLLFLSYMPDRVLGINNNTIISSNIEVDGNIAKILRELK